MTTMPKKQITLRETKLVKAKVNGMTNAKAYVAAGYSAARDDVAEANARKVLAKPNVQNALRAALEKHGITLDVAIAPISKALKATKIEIHGNGEEAFAEEVEDIDLQLKGSDRALKLMGVGQDMNPSTVNFIQVVKDQRDKYGI